VEREDESGLAGGPELFERCRHALEGCDSVQGFQLLLDADSGFGGMGAALLTRIRDDYTRAPCLTLGLGAMARPPPPPKPDGARPNDARNEAHAYAPALNDALALTAFSDLATAYVPLYGSSAVRMASDAAAVAAEEAELLCVAPPYVALDRRLRYHTSAPIALLLDCATLPCRAHAPSSSLGSLAATLAPGRATYLAAASLATPLPPDARPPPPPYRPADAAWEGPPLDPFRFDWFRPLAPLQLAPRCRPAHEQVVSWLGLDGGGIKAAPVVRSLLPSRGAGGSLWVRPQPLVLPLSFPQFFSDSMGKHGAALAPPGYDAPPPAAPRPPQAEVMTLPCASALQCTGALRPLLDCAASEWRGWRPSAERAASTEGWGQRDELRELDEQLAALREAYAELDAGHGDELFEDDGADDDSD